MPFHRDIARRVLWWGCLAACGGAFAQVDDALYEAGADWFTRLVPAGIQAEYEWPSRENWDRFWRDLEDALHFGSLEDLARMAPQLERAQAHLEALPAARPYAAWLRQRLDFFEMAAEAESVVAPAAPARPPPATRPSPAAVPPRAVAPAVPAPVRKGREAYVEKTKSWERKLKHRPPPPAADALVPRLKRIFVEEGLPPQAVWLAEVESSLDPAARSPAGAAGLFQFMPATARRFGLQTTPRDERLEPEKSARAAARYLRALHGQFRSWPLAFAAYNAGEGRVGKLLRQRPGASFEDIQAGLPVETRMYVPKILALVALREKMDPSDLPPPRSI